LDFLQATKKSIFLLGNRLSTAQTWALRPPANSLLLLVRGSSQDGPLCPDGVMANKAHSAVVRRLFERYGSGAEKTNAFDVHIGDLIIEVETTATLLEAVERLQRTSGRRFIAVTNREAIADAVSATNATAIGVMDPWGEIVREAS